jgi:hypothetical protein
MSYNTSKPSEYGLSPSKDDKDLELDAVIDQIKQHLVAFGFSEPGNLRSK